MTERAEGFWWVRARGRSRKDYSHGDRGEWCVVSVRGGDVYWPGDDIGEPVALNVRYYEHEVEWGPYLGTEPTPFAEPLIALSDVHVWRDGRCAKCGVSSAVASHCPVAG